MWKRRIIWLALLLGALIFYLFENNGRTLAALLLCGLAPPVSFLYAYFRCRNASIQITAPERISCGTAADCMIRSSAEGNTTLYIENLHNSEEEQYPLALKKGDNSFKLHTDCCGAVEFRIQGMEARDLFGLFSHKISRETRQQGIVIPNLFPVEILMTESAHAMPDSDRYSSVKPGYDPSETFGMREYVPGDSIKAIHWKLSQKTGKTIVREMGLPIVSQVLLRYQAWKDPRPEPKEIHSMTTVFVSVAAALQRSNIDFCMEWAGQQREILSEEELVAAIEELMGCPVWKQRENLSRGGGYSHVVTVSPDDDPTLADRFNGSRITLIAPGEGAGGSQPDGIWRINFRTDAMEEQLAVLEI